MNLIDATEPPFLTAALAGIGGRIKVQPEDFEVEEIPAYEPSGEGEHLFIWIEKRGLGAEYFIRQVAKRLDIPASEVGSAGMKDRHAVTRQYVSVPANAEDRVGQLDGNGLRVLRFARHGNKLKMGHLHGNRFRILIRDADRSKENELRQVVEVLGSQGVPNYYGSQRFGKEGETLEIGWRILKREGKKVGSPFLRKLALSAVQSLLFNRYLGQRLVDGLFRKVMPGDVMAKWPAGGMFNADDLAVEQERFDRRETVHAGPIFGRKTFPAKAEAEVREKKVLEEAGLTLQSFEGFGKLLMGTRRHNVIYADGFTSEWETEGLRLSFSLPAGCYATVLLREIMKTQVEGESE